MSAATLPTPAPAKREPRIQTVARLLPVLRPNEPALFHGISWDEYRWLSDYRDEICSGIRLVYDRGRLELVAPSFFHERVSRRLAQTVIGLSGALKIPVLAGGATTFSREDLANGLEPDECFYIQNIEVVRPLDDIDLSVRPPPDLAIEVDYTNSTIPKQPIYARLGVPELWRFDDATVTFLIRQLDGSYTPQPNSRAFPLVNSAELSRFVMSHTHLDEAAFLLNCMSWATAAFAPPQP
jgi:Uma2 family endonuclease